MIYTGDNSNIKLTIYNSANMAVIRMINTVTRINIVGNVKFSSLY